MNKLHLFNEPSFPGCLVPSRLIGVIEANQTEEGETIRNDRLIDVSCKSPTHDHIKSIMDLNENLIEQIKPSLCFL